MTRLILPEQNGVPNLEIKRVQREIEQERATRPLHAETQQEVAAMLDNLRRLTDAGAIQALLAVAMVKPGANLPAKTTVRRELMTVLSAPRDPGLILDLAEVTALFLERVTEECLSPPPNNAG